MKVTYRVVKAPKGLMMKELKTQVIAIRPSAGGVVAEVKLYCRRATKRSVKPPKPRK